MNKRASHKLTKKDEKKLSKLLGKLGDKMSYEIFREVSKKFVLTPVEAVVMRKNSKGSLQVLLTKRAGGDPDWSGKLHIPGTILRNSDINKKGDYTKAFKRLEEKEIKKRFSEKPVFVGMWFTKTKRGVENALIFVCKIEGNPEVGEFYDIDKLPKSLIKSQVGFIKLAAKEAKKRNLLD